MAIDSIIPKAGYLTIRDQIAVILALEVSAQLALAIAEGDTEYQAVLESFYKGDDTLSIYVERFQPFDIQELNALNVYITNVDESEGSNSRQQKGKVSINIDVTTLGEVNDLTAAHRMQRMASTIRGVLSSGFYKTLGFSPNTFIRRRWVTSVQTYQPNETDNTGYLYAGTVQFIVEYEEMNVLQPTSVLSVNYTDITVNPDGRFSLEFNN